MTSLFDTGLEADRLASRAAALLARPGAWLEPSGADYAVRLGPDRRRRPALRIAEPAFEALAKTAGLKRRPGGGYVLAAGADAGHGAAGPAAGRPGFIPGQRAVADGDGRFVQRPANLGESPLAWLARRKDPHGRPWLSAAQIAAAERLREDFYLAGQLGRLTMSWEASPRARGGRGPGQEPAERARAAKDRLAAALDAMGPGLKEVVEQVCLHQTSIEAAERGLDLPRRAGKAVLRLALDRLAAHYRIG